MKAVQIEEFGSPEVLRASPHRLFTPLEATTGGDRGTSINTVDATKLWYSSLYRVGDGQGQSDR
jgi:hypothetical protein